MDLGSRIYQHVHELLEDRLICGLVAFCFTLIVIMTIDECVALLNKSSAYNSTIDLADHAETKQESDSGVVEELRESALEETPAMSFEEFGIREAKGVGSGDGHVLESNLYKEEKEEKEGEGLVDEEVLFDDWEGIESTDLEKRFGKAVAFVASISNAKGISDDVRIRLQGLHKIATRGACHGPQPIALKFSARSEWKAWRRLGDMSRESAMEQYLALLSASTPEWEKERM